MLWSNVFGMTLGFLACFYVIARIERRWLWLGLLFFVAPTVISIVVWANLVQQWPELITALGAAVVLGGVWWWWRGRRLGRVTSDPIKVWGQDAAPKPRPAEMQAELQRLKEEKEKLEAELRRLRGDKQD
jgi:hypothetical protein